MRVPKGAGLLAMALMAVVLTAPALADDDGG